MRVEAWGESVIGLVRRRNEDAYAMRPQQGLFVVADGLGAHPHGDRASRVCVDVITERLLLTAEREAGADMDLWPAALAAALSDAHQRLKTMTAALTERPSALPMASTAVALALPVNSRHAYWIHNGDSRLYRMREQTLALLTADHTSYGDSYRDSQVVPVDLEHTNTLNQALGIDGGVDLQSASAAAVPGDVFLLCTDGISGMLEPEVIARLLGDSVSPAAAGQALLDAAMQAGGRDNATLIVVRVVAD